MMKRVAIFALALGVLALAAPAYAVDFFLIAKEFDKTLPDGTVKMWGFAEDPAGACYAAPSTISADCTDPVASSPGPRLSVSPAETGVTIYVTNLLSTAAGGEGVSVTIPGQPAPSPAGPTWNDGSVGTAGVPGFRRVRSFGVEAAPDGGQATYEWTGPNALRDGTFLYHSGTHPQVQVQMGLYGAITRDTSGGAPPPSAFDSYIDPVTDLEWLALTETLGDSVSTALANNPGWDLATTSQAVAMFENAGFVGSANNPANDSAAALLLSELGCTLFCGTNFDTGRGWTDDGADFCRPDYHEGPLGAGYGGAVLCLPGPDPSHANAGVFLVRTAPAGSGVVYGNAFDRQVVLVYSEIDPVLHDAVTLGTYGTSGPTSTLDYQPEYFLVNGEPFTTKAAATITGPAAGQRTLLRMLNAGLQTHTPTLQGLRMSIIAEDGYAYPEPRDEHSALLAPLKTKDAILAPNVEGTHALYDGMLNLSDTTGAVAGMLSFLEVGAGTPPANTAPVAVDDPAVPGDFDVDQNNILTAAAPGVLGNDSDPEGDALTAVLGTFNVTDGSLDLYADGSFDYEPDLGFFGMDTFTYKASDGVLESAEATVTITVVAVANNLPVADDKLASTGQQNAGGNSEAVAITLTGSDADLDGLTFTVTGGPTSGSLTGVEPNLTYTPNLGFFGSDSFTYKANDGTDDSLVDAVVDITVAENQAPLADVDTATTPKNTPVTFSVVVNDADPDPNGSIDVTSVVIVRQPRRGTLVVNGDGTVTYTPNFDAAGSDAFRYRVEDDDGELSRNQYGGKRTKVRVNITP